MSWVPLHNHENQINMQDKPRLLTEDEIRYIVQSVPVPPCADVASAKIIHKGIQESLSDGLRVFKTCPSGIPELIQTIITQYLKSQIAPGFPIGVLAAEAFGALMTQMTLNSFHSSGSAKTVSTGIDNLKDLVFARKDVKNPMMTIYFENKRITLEKVLEAQRYIVGSSVMDFVKDYDIRNTPDLSKFWWHQANQTLLGKQIPNSTKVLRLYLDTTKMYKHRVSISNLASVLEREVPPSIVALFGPISDGIIDLYPMPEFIAETLRGKKKEAIPPQFSELAYLKTVVYPELSNIRVKGISGIHNLTPVVSQTWKMVIQERRLRQDELSSPALKETLGPHINNGWLLYYNENVMYITGLVPENLAALCQLAGMTIIGGDDQRLFVTLPSDSYRTKGGLSVKDIQGTKAIKLDPADFLEIEGNTYYFTSNDLVKETNDGYLFTVDELPKSKIQEIQEFRNINGKLYRKLQPARLLRDNTDIYEIITNPNVIVEQMKPSEYLQMKLSKEKQVRNEEIKRLTDELIKQSKEIPEGPRRKQFLRRVVDVPRTPLMEAAEYVIAETEGINMEEILALPGIDKRRTTCNNMHILTKVLGIEATRNFIVRALYTTIYNTGNSIDPSHISVIAEVITNRGEPYGATFTGISRQPGGYLSLATLERAGIVLTESSIHGKEDNVQNASSSIVVGRRINIGDGSFDIVQDITVNGVPKRVINDDLFNALESDDATIELKRAKVPVRQVQEVETSLDELKTIAIGGNFDYTAGEDQTNLVNLFGQGAQIVDLATATEQSVTTTKVVRRVAAPEVPTDLFDVLNTIKIGVPRDDIPKIKPLEKVVLEVQPTVVKPQLTTQPIVSTGLVVPLGPLVIQETSTDLPKELLDMFTKFADILGLPQELPRVEIPSLPDLEGLDEVEVPTQRGVQPINVQAFREHMTKM